MRPYASFLVRCWRLPSLERRIKLEHIQSGAILQTASWEEAVAWIGTCLDEVAATPDWEAGLPLGPPDSAAERTEGGEP